MSKEHKALTIISAKALGKTRSLKNYIHRNNVGFQNLKL